MPDNRIYFGRFGLVGLKRPFNIPLYWGICWELWVAVGRPATTIHDAMLCYAVLCYAMLCYAMLCYALLCYALLCYAMLCCAVLCYAMSCHVVLYEPID